MKEILIKNVTILTMDDENSRFFGWILLKNGKIDALGEGEPLACSEVLDGEGGRADARPHRHPFPPRSV